MRDGVDEIIEEWRRERPDLDPSPMGVVGRISRLARELEARLEPVYRAHGLEPGWHDVLATLRRIGPPVQLRPSDFAGTLMLTSSASTWCHQPTGMKSASPAWRINCSGSTSANSGKRARSGARGSTGLNTAASL